MKMWRSFAFALLASIIAAARVAFAQSLECPAPPQLPVQSQEDEKIKGDLQGKAQFFIRMLANGNFQGAVEAERKTIYQSAIGLQAPWEAAYLTYLFCSTVMSDKALSSQQKLSAIIVFRQGMCTVPQSLLVTLAELVQEGNAIQSDFLQTNDPTTIKKSYAEWSSKVANFINDNLGVTYLVEFTTAHGGASMPVGHNMEGGGVWAEIQAKDAALTTIIQELRRC
jgi:hypothetical protein